MSNPIILPPLPEPAGTLVSPAMTAGSSWYSHGYTADQLRARDLEVAQLVLEAAAEECESMWGGRSSMSDAIRALEFHHAE